MIDALHATDPSPNRSIDPSPPGETSFGADLAIAAEAAGRPTTPPDPTRAPDPTLAADPGEPPALAAALGSAAAAGPLDLAALGGTGTGGTGTSGTGTSGTGTGAPAAEVRINNGGSCSCCTPGALALATDAPTVIPMAASGETATEPIDLAAMTAELDVTPAEGGAALIGALTPAVGAPSPVALVEPPRAPDTGPVPADGAAMVTSLPVAGSVVEAGATTPIAEAVAAPIAGTGRTSAPAASGSIQPDPGAVELAAMPTATTGGPSTDEDDPAEGREQHTETPAAGPRSVEARWVGVEPSGVGTVIRADTAAAPAGGTVGGTPVSEGVLRSEHVRVLRELAPNREVQRLAVDLDGARIALRFDGDGARVNVVSDPGNRLGGSWATDVQRTLNAGMRQNGGYQQGDPEGGRRNRQAYEPTNPFDEQRAAEFARRLDSIQET